MTRLFIALLCAAIVFLSPGGGGIGIDPARADAPKSNYSTAEHATILTASTIVGALAYCDDHSIYKNRTARVLYYRIAAHMAPHVQNDGTSDQFISRTGAEFFGLARSNGRAAIIAVNGEKFSPIELFEMRSESDCKKVEKLAFALMNKGALFDNNAEIPGESPA